jgi:hypothetical protein
MDQIGCKQCSRFACRCLITSVVVMPAPDCGCTFEVMLRASMSDISEGWGGSFTCAYKASVDVQVVSWTRDVVAAVMSFRSSINFGWDAKAEHDI